MNQSPEICRVGLSAGSVASRFERAAYSFLDLTEELGRCALQAAKLSAAYIAFFGRIRSPWRKRMGRRK